MATCHMEALGGLRQQRAGVAAWQGQIWARLPPCHTLPMPHASVGVMLCCRPPAARLLVWSGQAQPLHDARDAPWPCRRMKAEERAAEQDRVRQQVRVQLQRFAANCLLMRHGCWSRWARLCNHAFLPHACVCSTCCAAHQSNRPPALQPTAQYDAANKARREAEERDNRWLAQLSRPARVSFT